MSELTRPAAAAAEQQQRWHELEAVSQGRALADKAEAAWRDVRLAGSPHLALACGHLSPYGNGPLAQAGYGYCAEHGVSRIVSEPSDG